MTEWLESIENAETHNEFDSESDFKSGCSNYCAVGEALSMTELDSSVAQIATKHLGLWDISIAFMKAVKDNNVERAKKLYFEIQEKAKRMEEMEVVAK